MNVRRTITLTADNNDRNFLEINGEATRFTDFFKRMVISKTQVRRVVQMAAEINGVMGFGENDRLVTHGLRGTSVQMMLNLVWDRLVSDLKWVQNCTR